MPLRYVVAGTDGLSSLFKNADAGPGSSRDAKDRNNLRAATGGARKRARQRLLLNPALAVEAPGAEEDFYDRKRRGRKARPPSGDAAAAARLLRKRGTLPAIVFVFSRRGCEETAARIGRTDFLSDAERDRSRAIVGKWADAHADVAAPEASRLALLARGVASHHAGLLPQYKSLVEGLFSDGLVKVCVATETLAAGGDPRGIPTGFEGRFDRLEGFPRNELSENFLSPGVGDPRGA